MWAESNLRAAWLKILAGVALCLFAGAGAARLQFDSSYRVYFEPADPLLVAFDAVRNTFEPSDALLLLVVAEPGQSVLSPTGLAFTRALTAKAWLLPKVRRVDSLTNYQQVSADAEGFTVHDLVDPGTVLNARNALAIRAQALGDPLVVNRLVDRAGSIAVVSATLTAGTDSLQEVDRVMRAARALVAANKVPGFNVQLSGIVAMNYAFAESSQKDFATLVPAAFVLFFVIIAWTSGSILGSLYILALALLSIIASVGLLGWANIPLTSASSMAPLMLITIAIADGVHILMTCRAGIVAGKTPAQALAACMTLHRRLITLTALATIVGFLSMNSSNVPALRVMGNLVAVGTAIAAVLSLYWLPALLALRMPKWERAASRMAWLERMFALNERRALWICIAGAALLAITPLGLRKLELNDEFVRYFSHDLEFRQAADIQAARLGSLYEIEFAIDAKAHGGVHDPRYLATVVEFEKYLRGLPQTRHVLGWVDVLQRIHTTVEHGEGRATTTLPADRKLAAQYLLMYQLSLPMGQDANNLVSVDQSKSRVIATFGELSSVEMLDIEEAVQHWWAKHGGGYVERHGSINLIFSHLGKLNVLSMIESDIAGVAVIALIIGVALRSFMAGVLSLFMNFVPLVIAFAIWGETIGGVGLSLSAAAGMSLGILVDDAVHLLSEYARERKHGLSAAGALRTALTELAPPVLVTNAALIVGFGLVALSSFQLNAHLGLITVITLVLALGVDLVLLPAIILVAARWGSAPLRAA